MLTSFVPLRVLMVAIASLMLLGMFPEISDAGCHRGKGRRGGFLREFRSARALNQAGNCQQSTQAIAEPVYTQPVNVQPAPVPKRKADVQFDPLCPVCPVPGK